MPILATDDISLSPFRQLFENSPEAIVMLDREDRIVDANRAFQALFGYALDELKGRFINDAIVPQERVDEATQMTLAVLGNAAVQRETLRRRKDGTLVEVAVLGYPITLDGEQVGVFAIYRDVTESKRIASQIAYQATHDALTGLINRQEFERVVQAAIRSGSAGRPHCLLYLDVDQFKVVNESLGHDAGDHLLVELSEVVRAQLRGDDTMGRIGGDKFGVLLRNCAAEDASVIARRIVAAVRERRFRWLDHTMSLGVSVGLVGVDGWTHSLSELLGAADNACQAAKEDGRGRVQLFRPDDKDLLRRRGLLSWASRITDALDTGKVMLYFQRIVPVSQGDGGGARYEVLLRVHEADRHIALPGLFISAAERYGLMPAVDRHVVASVVRRLHDWHGAGIALPELVSINVSGASVSDEDFGAYVREQIARTRVPPRALCFEITETSAIANLGRALAFIRDMRAQGCSVALDDFGAGMSSFHYLKSLSVDYLKIDGGFIRDIVRNPVDCAMAEAINKVGQVKGIKTVAEFVEDEATLAKLRDLGVDYAQGFFIHQPEPWDAAAAAGRMQ
ncbi:MAG: EAL domain-containing protein [Gammaproteobacteria bacterium]|nr:EAL domain-containing protein [Gammaproteobacteria bacterium]